MTLEQLPAYTTTLGEDIRFIKELLLSAQTTSVSVEKPMDIEGAAEFTGLKIPTLYSLAQRGEIPAHKKGKKYFLFASELSSWIKSGGKSAVEQKAENDFLKANKKRALQK